MSSIYPTDYGDIEVQGNIQFAMSYIQKLGEFHIFVVHCQDLAVGDTKKSRTDPWVNTLHINTFVINFCLYIVNVIKYLILNT